MSRPVRNRKVVNYSQFQESDDADEQYGRDSERPKKMRAAPREMKHKRGSGKNSREDSGESDEKLSKSKNESADDLGGDEDFGEEEDKERGSDYNTKRGKKGKKVSSRTMKRKRDADDSDDEREVSKKVRQVRQAASKAVSKQREMLLGDGGSEDKDREEAFMDRSGSSDEDFMVDDDDDSDYGRSKKRSKKVIRRSRPERKEKKSPKPRLKATVTPSPMKGKGKGRVSTVKALEKTLPKEEEGYPESAPEDEDELENKYSSSPKKTEEAPEDDMSEEEAPSGEN